MKNMFLIIFVFCNVFLSSNGFDVTFENPKGGNPAYGWKTSRTHPFRYFKSISEIDEAFLPVHTGSLPDGDGLWVLRYKDISHLPIKFASNERDPSKSFIEYSSKSQLFSKITIKALSVGDVQLELALGTVPYTEILSLSSIQKCSEVIDADTGSSSNDGFKWTTYEIHTSSSSSQVAIEVLISHPKSFFILDEMSVSTFSFSEPDDTNFDDENITKIGNFKVRCKSD